MGRIDFLGVHLKKTRVVNVMQVCGLLCPISLNAITTGVQPTGSQDLELTAECTFHPTDRCSDLRASSQKSAQHTLHAPGGSTTLYYYASITRSSPLFTPRIQARIERTISTVVIKRHTTIRAHP
jgi:hypothetical protein